MPSSDIAEYTASGKHKYVCNFCQGPDGNPLCIDKRRWNRHSKSAAHSSSRLLNTTKRLQAIKPTLHEQPTVPAEDTSRAYKSAIHSEQDGPTLSSGSAPRYDGESTSSASPDFDQPFTDGATIHNNDNGTAATTENSDLFLVTDEDPLVDYKFNDTANGPETPLKSGYEHWRTAYDSEDSYDDDEDDFDEMFAGYLASGGARPGDTPRIIGSSSRVERLRQAPLAKSDSEPWFPWPSQSMFLADILFTANRLEFSRKQAKAVLAFARATGGKDIPTLSALSKTRKKMLEVTGSPTTRHESDTGHVFYVNEITDALAKASI